MVRRRVGQVSLAALGFLVLLPALSLAQTGIIAGLVKDTSGAVMPGVTVEAASPALIEKVRTAVTDGSGQYKIVDLTPAHLGQVEPEEQARRPVGVQVAAMVVDNRHRYLTLVKRPAELIDSPSIPIHPARYPRDALARRA